jgi:hypothetical protein
MHKPIADELGTHHCVGLSGVRGFEIAEVAGQTDFIMFFFSSQHSLEDEWGIHRTSSRAPTLASAGSDTRILHDQFDSEQLVFD